MQKVFKSRFDEGRSNAKLQDISNSTVNYMFINSPKASYESLLGKNKDSFFTPVNYNQTIFNIFTDLTGFYNTLNVYFTSLPFLVSNYSDSARYLWFDWHSRWTSLEVQPSSVARYSLIGVPYTTKPFEYTTQTGDEISDSENYIIRLGRARKNYLSNWVYTPYFHNRLLSWYYTNPYTQLWYTSDSILQLKLLIGEVKSYWNSPRILIGEQILPAPASSGTSTPGRASGKPLSLAQSYHYSVSILIDLLIKREYLYRTFLRFNEMDACTSNYLVASPRNTLLREVKYAFPFYDPSSYSSEVSREFFYTNTNFLKLSLLNQALKVSINLWNYTGIKVDYLSNYLFFYVIDLNKPFQAGTHLELFKKSI